MKDRITPFCGRGPPFISSEVELDELDLTPFNPKRGGASKVSAALALGGAHTPSDPIPLEEERLADMSCEIAARSCDKDSFFLTSFTLCVAHAHSPLTLCLSAGSKSAVIGSSRESLAPPSRCCLACLSGPPEEEPLTALKERHQRELGRRSEPSTSAHLEPREGRRSMLFQAPLVALKRLSSRRERVVRCSGEPWLYHPPSWGALIAWVLQETEHRSPVETKLL